MAEYMFKWFGGHVKMWVNKRVLFFTMVKDYKTIYSKSIQVHICLYVLFYGIIIRNRYQGGLLTQTLYDNIPNYSKLPLNRIWRDPRNYFELFVVRLSNLCNLLSEYSEECNVKSLATLLLGYPILPYFRPLKMPK